MAWRAELVGALPPTRMLIDAPRMSSPYSTTPAMIYDVHIPSNDHLNGGGNFRVIVQTQLLRTSRACIVGEVCGLRRGCRRRKMNKDKG